MSYERITAHDSRNFTPAASVPAVFGRARTIESITIHWWGLPEWGDTFDGVVNFLCTNTKPTSAHEVIEAGKVAVLVAHEDASWAAGNAVGNATSIHLECRPRASDADYATVAERVRDIRAMHGKHLPLIPHRDWQATMCPGVWDLARIDALASGAASQGGTITPAGDLANTSTPKEWDEMATEAQVAQACRVAIDGWSISDGFQKRLDGRSPVDFLIQLRAEQGGLIATVRALTAAVSALATESGNVTPEQVDKSIKEAVAAWASEYEPAIVKKDAQ